MTLPTIDESQIRETAYLLWLDEGQPQGRDQEHWLRAIDALTLATPKAKSARKAAAKPRAAKAAPGPDAKKTKAKAAPKAAKSDVKPAAEAAPTKKVTKPAARKPRAAKAAKAAI